MACRHAEKALWSRTVYIQAIKIPRTSRCTEPKGHSTRLSLRMSWSLSLDGWQALSTRKFCSRQPCLSESLGETTVLMNRQYSSQQMFFDLLGELTVRAIFLFAMGVVYHGHFSFRNELDVCSLQKASVPSSGFSMRCLSVPSSGFSTWCVSVPSVLSFGFSMWCLSVPSSGFSMWCIPVPSPVFDLQRPCFILLWAWFTRDLQLPSFIQQWEWFTMAMFLFSNISVWYPGFSLACWHILRTCRQPIPLQERPSMPAPTVSENEDGGELITPVKTVPVERAAFECF